MILEKKCVISCVCEKKVVTLHDFYFFRDRVNE